MKIKVAHLRTQGIDFAVFDADARSKSNRDRANLLAELTYKAQNNGLKIDKSALAYSDCGRLSFYGTEDLVNYLSKNSITKWTHTIEV